VIGYAVTAEVQPLNIPGKILDWNEYYDELANSDYPLISILKDIDNPSGRGASFGDVMAYRHVALGVSGVVIDGSLRDLEGIKEAKCPIWAKGRVPGHGPFNLVSLGKTIEVSGLKISHGDLLVCDQDGITNIPLNDAEKISRVCEDVRKDESNSKDVFSSKDFDYESWRNKDKEY
jgi:regulator of RNase E activity RraA